jgi:hypothetical protein
LVGDQLGQQNSFQPVYFRAWDKEATITVANLTYAVEPGIWRVLPWDSYVRRDAFQKLATLRVEA